MLSHSLFIGHLTVLPVFILFRCSKKAFSKALKSPARSYVAVLGGKKVRDKLPLIQNLVKIVDEIVISGGMAFTFAKFQGMPIGTSALALDPRPTVSCV
jgi:phosphoglycerate kinase